MLYCFAETPCFFCSKSKILWRTQFLKVNFLIFFLSSRWLAVWHNRQKKFAKRQRNHSNSKNDNRKIKLFRKRNIFFLKKFHWKREFLLCEPRRKLFHWKPSSFSSQSPKKVDIMFIFQIKMLFLKTLQRCLDCSFDNHANKFSLIVKTLLSKSSKNWNSTFFSLGISFSLVCSSRHFFQFCQPRNKFSRCCLGNFKNNPGKLICLETCFKTVAVKVFFGSIGYDFDNLASNFWKNSKFLSSKFGIVLEKKPSRQKNSQKIFPQYA